MLWVERGADTSGRLFGWKTVKWRRCPVGLRHWGESRLLFDAVFGDLTVGGGSTDAQQLGRFRDISTGSLQCFTN